MLSASYKLAEEFVIIPYPFVGGERDQIKAEYATLLNQGVKPTEVSDIILHALEILLNNRDKRENPNTYDSITLEISDMLGRLLILEEMFLNKEIKKRK